MKRTLILLLGIAVAGMAYAQSAPRANGPVITWDKATHVFGDIQKGDKVEYTFKFSNTGTEPLIITNVTVTCGCTTPKGWPRDPIAPGGKGEIVVAFDSTTKSGKQDKVVTVLSNAVNADGGQLRFTANVITDKKPAQ